MIYEIPVAQIPVVESVEARRMLRPVPERGPRDARPSRARRDRMPARLRARAASSRRRD
jgi:hypothetical protein